MLKAAGSGEDDKAHREFEAALRRRQRPENEVPISVAIDAVLADGQEVVVFISGARVFSNGVDFTLEVRARHGTNDGRGGMLGGVHGHGDPSNRLLLGVEFSDGRRCTNIGAPFTADFHDSADRPLLTPGGGSGGTRASDISLFLSPLPPPGDLRVVCAWPKFGLPEKITVLSADAIVEAAHRVRVLWPWEPEPEPEWGAKPPKGPEGGRGRGQERAKPPTTSTATPAWGRRVDLRLGTGVVRGCPTSVLPRSATFTICTLSRSRCTSTYKQAHMT
mgnify:CR=1 FL=1